MVTNQGRRRNTSSAGKGLIFHTPFKSAYDDAVPIAGIFHEIDIDPFFFEFAAMPDVVPFFVNIHFHNVIHDLHIMR